MVLSHSQLVLFKLSLHADIDECDLGVVECGDEKECMNTDGSYLCVCETGFSQNGTLCKGM